MDKRELDMYKLEDAVNALLDNMPIKQIARRHRISKNTVKKYRSNLELILSEKPYLKGNISEIMKEFREARGNERYSLNHGWLLQNSTLVEELSAGCDNYARLLQVLNEKGFNGSYSSLMRYVSKNNINNNRACFRIESKPGEIAQVDFGCAGKIYDDVCGEKIKAYIFVMVLGFSRDAYYEIVKDQNINTWCSCHAHAFEHFGGVPRIIIPDNLKSAVIKAAYCDPMLNKSYADCAKHYGFQIDPCLPGTPEHKGKVESGVKYVKNNFLPLRTFKNFSDANNQIMQWNEDIARKRVHGTTRRKPIELFLEYEKDTLLPLPEVRFETPLWKTLKVGKDIHIQFDKSYYSVPHSLIGSYVEVRKTQSQLTVFYDNELVAVHYSVSEGKRRTNKDHYPAESGKYIYQDSDYCISEALKIGFYTAKVVKTLLEEEALRNLRGAQKIINLKENYSNERIEKACLRSSSFGNNTYASIKTILENELDRHSGNNFLPEKVLSFGYARNIDEIINKEIINGNICSN